ncbi:ribonuclease domain-containing protein [Pimelobacter simplex]|uniref:ribonuclease domain-containing protein n=1 Tax=Nocardioides simplex TaxID=2045 RepID=UPI0019349A85|nr:ribonuclease [Pimelobacter simplex]
MTRRTTQVVSTAITIVLLVAVWWLQSRGSDDAPDRAVGEATPSVTASQSGEEAPRTDEAGIPYVDLGDLPPEAAETVALIDAGGPFPYPGKDGSTFGNFEGLLPDRPRGYYAEYTVETPGLEHRGARRIIAGDGGELYWTEDHYESFERIRRVAP